MTLEAVTVASSANNQGTTRLIRTRDGADPVALACLDVWRRSLRRRRMVRGAAAPSVLRESACSSELGSRREFVTTLNHKAFRNLDDFRSIR